MLAHTSQVTLTRGVFTLAKRCLACSFHCIEKTRSMHLEAASSRKPLAERVSDDFVGCPMMTERNTLPPLEGRSVRLLVGNTPVSARVVELSGLALRLSVSEEIAAVPRVRVELEEAEESLTSLQLQGMVTGRDSDEVTVTLERLMVAAGRESVDLILGAWFAAVPKSEACYQPMMRGYGYELRKAILTGRGEGTPRPKKRAHDPATDTLDGFPPVAVRVGMERAQTTKPFPETARVQPKRTMASPPLGARVSAASPPPRLPRSALAPQVAKTGMRLLANTTSIRLALDCSTDAAGYGRGLLYRIAAGGRLGFVAARGVRPGFGARVELITDLEQSGLSVTVRIASSVVWVAPDPDYPNISLMAVRLAPTNERAHLHSWDTCCELALRQGKSEGGLSLLPSRQLIESIEN